MSGRYNREEETGTSWASVVFGWLAALGANLILSGVVGAIVAAIFAALGFRGGTEGGITSLVGLVITLFLSFLVGAMSRDAWRAAPGPSTASWWPCWPWWSRYSWRSWEQP